MEAQLDTVYRILPNVPNLETLSIRGSLPVINIQNEETEDGEENNVTEDIYVPQKLIHALQRTPKLRYLAFPEGARASAEGIVMVPPQMRELSPPLPALESLILGNVFVDDWFFPAMVGAMAGSLKELSFAFCATEDGVEDIITAHPFQTDFLSTVVCSQLLDLHIRNEEDIGDDTLRASYTHMLTFIGNQSSLRCLTTPYARPATLVNFTSLCNLTVDLPCGIPEMTSLLEALPCPSRLENLSFILAEFELATDWLERLGGSLTKLEHLFTLDVRFAAWADAYVNITSPGLFPQIRQPPTVEDVRARYNEIIPEGGVLFTQVRVVIVQKSPLSGKLY